MERSFKGRQLVKGDVTEMKISIWRQDQTVCFRKYGQNRDWRGKEDLISNLYWLGGDGPDGGMKNNWSKEESSVHCEEVTKYVALGRINSQKSGRCFRVTNGDGGKWATGRHVSLRGGRRTSLLEALCSLFGTCGIISTLCWLYTGAK